MASEQLQKARDFEEKYIPYIPEESRPAYHVTGGIGWINDPNGFSVYKGEYHLFYQYHPYSTYWGPMYWGHVKTTDFIRWERLPVAMAPDEDVDRDGCFSGSAIELPDGRQLLMYTGVYEVRREDGYLQKMQHQCLALGDGVNYEKYEGNPVLDASDLPDGGSVIDFRDPKIWKDGDTYYAVVGNRPADGSGAILLFESKDVFHWQYITTLDTCNNQYGKMWECPDFFPVDGKWVILTSPQEMQTMGAEFHAGNGTLCLIGSYDREDHNFQRERVQSIDYGLDFYAPQTLEALDGRRIMIGWMQNWATCICQPENVQFFGMMTIPRELHVKENKLIQNPVRELERYRGRKTAYQNVLVTEETSLGGISGRILDMTVTIRPADSNGYRWFKINVAKDGECVSFIRYKPESNRVRVDRSHGGFPYDIVNTRDFLVRSNHGEIKLRVLLDRYSMEVFVNDGEQAASSVLYTPVTAEAITFEADGAVLMDVEKYELNFS